MRCVTDSMLIFDRQAVRRHRDRAAGRVAGVAPILHNVAERLLDRLDDTTTRFTAALDIGGRGVVAPMLRARGIPTVSLDISARMAALSGSPALCADEERLPIADASVDLVVANLSLHWVNELPGALIQLRRALRPDGLFLASLPVLGTLQALRQGFATAEDSLRGGASPRLSPFPELADCASLLQRAGFALPVADLDQVELAYADPIALLRDLQAAGEQNAILARDRRIPPAALFAEALAGLPQRDGRTVATLRLGMLTGWSPAPSQPQPKARGSATIGLEEALRRL